MIRLISLYPRAWRDRYGLEFQTLMSERPPTPRDRLDIVRGALDARLHPQLREASPDGTPRQVRIGATVAVLGGGLWIAAGFAFLGSSIIPELGYKDSSSAVVIAMAGALVTGIAAFLVASSLPARSALTNAAIAIVLGALAMTQPWPVVFFGFFAAVIGTLLFGLIVAPRIGMTGILVSVAAIVATAFNTEDERALLLVPLGAAWMVFGTVLAYRGIPSRVDLTRLTAALQPPRSSI